MRSVILSYWECFFALDIDLYANVNYLFERIYVPTFDQQTLSLISNYSKTVPVHVYELCIRKLSYMYLFDE